MVVVGCYGWRMLAFYPFCPALGHINEQQPGSPQCQQYPFVLLPKILVKKPIDHSIEAAVKIGHKIAQDKKPFWNVWLHF